MRPLLAHCHAMLAALARRTGAEADAAHHAATAAMVYGQLGITSATGDPAPAAIGGELPSTPTTAGAPACPSSS